MQYTQLVPVSEWRYHLYAIRYTDEKGNTLEVRVLASTDHDGTILALASEYADHPRCEWIEWYCIEENIPHPRVIGQIYGTPIHENGWSHGEWANGRSFNH